MLHPEPEPLVRHADDGIVHSPTLSGQSAILCSYCSSGVFIERVSLSASTSYNMCVTCQ